jgi:dihydroorotate dehydrogenase (fumarate)
MDLSTNYMGLALNNPIIVGSSKLTSTFENVKKCIDNGAGAVVLKSIFEEQLLTDPEKLKDQDAKYIHYPEAIDYINTYAKSQGLTEYLELIKESKAYSDTPIIASINCVSDEEWPKFSQQFEKAGADALELNIAISPFNSNMESQEIEAIYVSIVKKVKKNVSIPVSVKIGSCFTNVSNITLKLQNAGADAIVLFNRFYRPDIDIKKQSLVNDNFLSAPQEINQSLHWVSVLSNQLSCDIAASTGMHDYEGVVKQLLVGADSTQICSALYNKGIVYIETILFDLKKWMQKNEYEAIADFKSKIARSDENAAAFQRVQFMKQTVE